MQGVSVIVPHGHVPSRAYIGFPVEESMAQRSSVIAALMGCEGVVELPEGLEVCDVQAWAEVQPEEATKLSTEELAEALKVTPWQRVFA